MQGRQKYTGKILRAHAAPVIFKKNFVGPRITSRAHQFQTVITELLMAMPRLSVAWRTPFGACDYCPSAAGGGGALELLTGSFR